MPTTSWQVTNIGGADYLVFDVAKFRVPLDWDPSSGMFIAVAVPDGGVGSLPVLAKGDPGDVPTITSPVVLTALNYTDPTPDSATLAAIGTNNYQLNLTLHKGPPGVNGTSVLNPTAYGTPVAGYGLIVNPTADGFAYQAPKVGDRYLPATINSTPAGNVTYNLAVVSVPPLLFDWRPTVSGQSVIAPNSGDTAVDLVARLNNQAAGAIVGRGVGVAGLSLFGWPPLPATMLAAGPPAGSSDTYDKVLAGNSATIFLNAERRAGSGTFTTDAATTTFQVRVSPVP